MGKLFTYGNIGYGPEKVYGKPTTYVTGTVEDKNKDIGIKIRDFVV